MVLLFTDPRMLDHVPKAGHPERPERLSAVLRHLDRTGLRSKLPSGFVRPATDEELLRVHTPGHLDRLRRFDADGGGHVEIDTWMSTGSELAARLAAGSAVEAVSAVLEARADRAFCVVRPPGHHARPDGPMGFCLYGTAAVAAAEAKARLQGGRVLIVDYDVHHGNGTQEAFESDPAVAFYSLHRYPFYPGSGARDETGTGPGLGWTRNRPIAYGTSRREILDAFRSDVEEFADRARPELVILSAGFDAHAEDPIGDLGLETEDFEAMTRTVLEIAESHASGRVVAILEGGYNTSRLAGCVEVALRTLGAE